MLGPNAAASPRLKIRPSPILTTQHAFRVNQESPVIFFQVAVPGSNRSEPAVLSFSLCAITC